MTLFLKLSPVCLCLLIGLLQPYWVSRYHADPWKLGGFRMFSQVSEKMLIFYGVATNDKTYRIQVSGNSLSPYTDEVNQLTLDRAESFPSDTNLEHLLTSMSSMKVVKESEDFKLASFNDALFSFEGTRVIPESSDLWTMRNIFKEISVSVWDLKFDHAEGKLRYVKSIEKTHRL